VHAASDQSGVVEISGVQCYIEKDTVMNSSRAPHNNMFASVFSSRIKKLYWYRPYFAMLNKSQAVCCNCVLECDNVLVMLLETRCASPHYHAVIYYPRAKECVIAKNPSKCPLKNFVLCPEKPLPVSVEELEM
jgi:hypothetical protein